MTIAFDSPKHEGLANDRDKLAKWCNKKTTATAEEVMLALNALRASPNLAELPPVPYLPHPLKQNYKGCFAVWVNKKERIIFRLDPDQNPPAIIYNYQTINSIVIVELCTDYHGR